jgi:preprotein translocase subunit SecB
MTSSDPSTPSRASSSHASKALVRRVKLLGEYIKNLSFESAQPVKFMEFGENPELEFDVDVAAVEQGKDLYEVMLNLEVHAKNDLHVIYHLELSYAGLFRLRNVPDEFRQQVLVGDCPKLIFPSLRRVVSDITYGGGFPPLMLDFDGLPGFTLRRS